MSESTSSISLFDLPLLTSKLEKSTGLIFPGQDPRPGGKWVRGDANSWLLPSFILWPQSHPATLCPQAKQAVCISREVDHVISCRRWSPPLGWDFCQWGHPWMNQVGSFNTKIKLFLHIWPLPRLELLAHKGKSLSMASGWRNDSEPSAHARHVLSWRLPFQPVRNGEIFVLRYSLPQMLPWTYADDRYSLFLVENVFAT